MNQAQREYLVDQVQKTCRAQTQVLHNQIPDRPSLNNYMIAAFLDNTIEFNDIARLKELMRDTVLKMGHGDSLIQEGSDWRRKSDDTYVKIKPHDLFVIPAAYHKAVEEYEKVKNDLQKKINALNSQADTIVMKLKIGSAKALETLISQVDNIADLDMMNNTLKLTAGNEDSK